MTVREVELDHGFAEALARSAEMQRWLLEGGRFRHHAIHARLLSDDQAAARPSARHWWKHWWCRMADGSEGETDIFLVFEADGRRFALHIENKPGHGILSFRQAAAYRPRAILKANDPAWLGYSDFETVVLAPRDFLASNAECGRQFDRTMTYEDVAAFVPLFGEAVAIPRTS